VGEPEKNWKGQTLWLAKDNHEAETWPYPADNDIAPCCGAQRVSMFEIQVEWEHCMLLQNAGSGVLVFETEQVLDRAETVLAICN
jgi:hypothetical protein